MPAEPRSTRRKRLDSILDRLDDDDGRDGRRATRSNLIGCLTCRWPLLAPGPVTTCLFCNEALVAHTEVVAANERGMREAEAERASQPRKAKDEQPYADDVLAELDRLANGER